MINILISKFKSKLKIIFILSLSIGIYLGFRVRDLGFVSAQESLSTTAIPPRLEVEALPGATLQETLKVRNESATDQAFEAVVRDFIVTGNQGTPVPVDETVSGRWSLSSWISISPKQLLLKAGETQTVNLIINIPPNGLAGGHYAMVLYSPINDNELGGWAAVSPQVGSLVYLKVIGDTTEAVNLKKFQAENFFQPYGPVKLTAEIENLGDIHLRPTGKLTVTNLLNDEVFSQNLEEKNIFPFASRAYSWTMPGKWHLGRYAARLTAQAGDSAIPISGLIYFWVIPIKELSLAGGALVLLIILAIVLKKRRQQPKNNVLAEEPHLA